MRPLLNGENRRASHEPWLRRVHRITGVGVFIFLVLHISHIWLLGFGPEPFNRLTLFYQHPIARLLQIFLFSSVLFHAVNGVRMTALDFWPGLLHYRRVLIWIAAVIFLIVFIPSSLLILMDAFGD
jgi:succinate dehydrogenase / fumarate reductase cytochrome b subunit